MTAAVCRNMNLMWSEMTDASREEYKQFFLAYHDTVARSVSVYQPRPSPCLLPRSGFTGQRIKPLTLLPASLLQGFQRAVLAKV